MVEKNLSSANNRTGQEVTAGLVPLQRQPMRLHLVFVWGFIASLGVVAGLTWLFAAYETANWWPWSVEPRLSQDKLFEVVRNAVTTAAALGVGVTLFFSYRRQQTAEETQRIGAEAQRTAAKAQEVAADALVLSNKQHGLDQQRRSDAVGASLRERYTNTAEQLGSNHLAVRLAGIYALAALADDWAKFGSEDERQICIDLLCAYLRSQPDEDSATRKELVTATLQVVCERLGLEDTRKHWGAQRITLVKPGMLPSLGPIKLGTKGQLAIFGARVRHARLTDTRVDGGLFELSDLVIEQALVIRGMKVTSQGKFRLSVRDLRADEPKRPHRPMISIQNLNLVGAEVDIHAQGLHVSFANCVFDKNSSLLVNVAGRSEESSPGRVAFKHCTFRSNVFADELWSPGDPLFKLSADFLSVDDGCVFENGAAVLKSFSRRHPGTEL